jgi:hypothetical protein
MAVESSATLSREFVITTSFVGGHPRQDVIAVGGGMVARTPIQLVPGSGLIGLNANQGTFISGCVTTPIQNLSNFSNGLKRFQVGRALLGDKSVEFVASSKAHAVVRARVQLVVELQRLAANKIDDTTLNPRRAFELYMNVDADSTFTLPEATRANVGLEYFFAVNPGQNAGRLSIMQARDRDAIQIRNSQNVKDRIVVTSVVKRVKKLTGTQRDADGANVPISVVIACRAPGLWVAENASADEVKDEATGVTESTTRWTFAPGDVIED